MSNNSVIAAMTDPVQLETLYYRDPQAFAENLSLALEIHPQAQILKFWQARLAFQDQQIRTRPFVIDKTFGLLLLLAGAAYLLARLPLAFGLDAEWYLPRFLPWIVFAALMTYNGLMRTIPRVTQTFVFASMVLLTLPLAMFPPVDSSDTATMALLHMPLLLWCLLGLLVTAGRWRDAESGIAYLQYCGELFILTVLILLGGMVLSGITMGLFRLLGLEIAEWYMTNVALAGGVSAPLLAGFVYDVVLHRRSHFANLIANIFAPLFLVMIVMYLVTMAVAHKSPYSDRDFLIMFNALQLLVLGMTIYSISGRRADHPSPVVDLINFGLVSVTLMVNLVALSAIVFRLSSLGLTPNRVVVTGVNLLIFAHLIRLLLAYLRLWRGSATAAELQLAVTRFLPAYGVWAVIVIVLLPALFAFR